MKYRKKPVVIDAIQFTGSLGSATEITEWTKERSSWHWDNPSKLAGLHLKIRTLEGEMRANPGDYIIKGVKGEFYPCKQDIFTKTYEPVD